MQQDDDHGYISLNKLMTGWQLTANRIYLCAMVSAQLATTRWCGSRPTCCDGMRLHLYAVWCPQSAVSGLLEVNKKSGIRHRAYNICTWRISVMAIRILIIPVFSVVNVFLFYCRLPSNIFTVLKTFTFLLSSHV